MKKSRTALTHVDTFTASLKERLPHHRIDRLRCVAEVILGILQAESTLHRKIALHINRNANTDSITKMVARVFHDAGLSQQDVLDILLPLLPPGKLTLVMDRTNWKLGQRSCNLLVLGVLIGNTVLPLAWTELDHSGNSHTYARMMLVGKLLKRLPAKRWAVLIADREFVGKKWFDFLKWKGIKRCIRIRENTAVDDDEYVRNCFTSLQLGQVQTLFERAWVYGSRMHVIATLSPQGERIVVASDLSVWDTLSTYRRRWSIETTFSAMKSRGLNLEQTHMTAPERIGKLFGLLCIALAWMIRVGEEVEAEQATRLKKHGRPAKSRTRRGYRVLSRAVRWASQSFQTLLELLNTPFCALGAGKTQPVRY